MAEITVTVDGNHRRKYTGVEMKVVDFSTGFGVKLYDEDGSYSAIKPEHIEDISFNE
jgi:hypothetical protein